MCLLCSTVGSAWSFVFYMPAITTNELQLRRKDRWCSWFCPIIWWILYLLCSCLCACEYLWTKNTLIDFFPKLFHYVSSGWPYKHMVRARWITGALCTLLVYPVLIHYQLSSHFLPWLPAGVAVYALYGALLSEKKFKVWFCL